MKDAYYADKRDLVKWSGIVHLCAINELTNVIQIAYYRHENLPEMSFDSKTKTIPIPREVFLHFRNIDDIRRLGDEIGLEVKVMKTPFDHNNRQQYLEEAIGEINRITDPKVVFLDPDTGLAPAKSCQPEHVSKSEVTEIWKSLNQDDILVFYQHRFRSGRWVEIRKKELAEACEVGKGSVKTWSAKIASDVVLYFIKKV